MNAYWSWYMEWCLLFFFPLFSTLSTYDFKEEIAKNWRVWFPVELLWNKQPPILIWAICLMRWLILIPVNYCYYVRHCAEEVRASCCYKVAISYSVCLCFRNLVSGVKNIWCSETVRLALVVFQSLGKSKVNSLCRMIMRATRQICGSSHIKLF